MSISAVVVTYNRKSLLKECLQHLLNQTLSLDNIFVVNNASTDGTKEYLKNLNIPKIKVINMRKNLGGAGGFSYGTKIAFESSKSDYFWLMDDDTMPTPSAAKALFDSAKKTHNDFGFLSSNVRWWKNGKASNVPVTVQNWSELISKSLIQIKEATFVSFFVPRKRVQELGLPIKEAFIWGDDTEYTNRMSQKYPCYFVPNSIVVHKSRALMDNESIFTEPKNRISFYKCRYRNRLYVDRKYYSSKKMLKHMANILLIFLEIPFKANNHRLMRMYYTMYGLLSGIFFNPTVKFPKINK